MTTRVFAVGDRVVARAGTCYDVDDRAAPTLFTATGTVWHHYPTELETCRLTRTTTSTAITVSKSTGY